MTTPTKYHDETPEEVRQLIERYIHSNKTVRVFYCENGKDWHEENDVCGKLGRSGGTQPIPLIIPNNSRSIGGSSLLDHCIGRMIVDGREVYRHPNYYNGTYTTVPSDLPGYETNVMIDGELHARFTKHASALRWIAFMNGERMAK